MRWVVLTDDYPPCSGGVAVWTRAVVEGLREAGDDVAVFARYRLGLSGAHGVRGPNFGRWGHRFLAWSARKELARADRVLATTWTVAQTAVHAKVPFDLVFHGSEVTSSDPRRKEVATKADRRFAVSGYLQGLLAREGIEAMVPPMPYHALPMSPLGGRWGFVGRATPLKGADRLLRLAAAARRTVEIIGDGPELPHWKALAHRLGVEAHFRGALPHADTLQTMLGFERLFLLSRIRPDGTGAEGLGWVLAEAAARGIPTVGSAVGGIPELATEVLGDPDDVEGSLLQLAVSSAESQRQRSQEILRGHGLQRLIETLRVIGVEPRF